MAKPPVSGMSMMMKSLGIDPAQIMDGVKQFQALAVNVQETVAAIHTELAAIRGTQADVLRRLDEIQRERPPTVLTDKQEAMFAAFNAMPDHSRYDLEGSKINGD